MLGRPLPALHPMRSAVAGFKPVRALVHEALVPAVIAGSGLVDGLNSRGIATAFPAQLRIQFQLGVSLPGVIRKSCNSFTGAVKFRVPMKGLHRVASCADC